MAEITIEKTGEDVASRSLRVTIPAERVQAAESKAVQYYAKQARLPGFRKGKAPEAVVRKRFGDAIRQSALQEVVREGWEQARETHALEPVAEPSVRNLKFEAGSDVEFDLMVEVRPQLSLERTGGFTLSRAVAPVSDDDIEEQLTRLREQQATWVPVESGTPDLGNLVRVEVATIREDGETEPQAYDVVLGEGKAMPDLEALIMTLEPGATAEGEVRFPDDHPDVTRRGQSQRVRLTLNEVKRQELPPADDAFAREAGDFDSMNALRAALREDLEREAEREADARVREEVIGLVTQANNVPAPESMVHRVLHAYANAYSIPDEQLGAFEGQFRPIAEATVRRELIVNAILDAESLRATESDVDARIAEMAAARGTDTATLYGSLQKNNRLSELERALTEEKVFSWLLAQSTVSEAAS